MPPTLYSVSDGPPSLAVRQCLKALNIDYNLINVDFGLGEHMTDEYAKKNPQKEIPVLDDDGFYLSESNAILQYLADKYAKDDKLYPTDVQARAIVNHRLCFNLSTYYRYISEHVIGNLSEWSLYPIHYNPIICIIEMKQKNSVIQNIVMMAPIFFDYKRTPLSLKKVQIALDNFNTYLERLGKKYAAGDGVTIADFQLITATMCLEAINFDFTAYKFVTNWYTNYKQENPELWSIVEAGMQEISDFEKNPPDLSHLNHPIHPVRKP